MAWIRRRTRANGEVSLAVMYELPDGTQTSATFDDEESAAEFRDTVNSIGAEKAMLAWGITPTKRSSTTRRSSAPTVQAWLQAYIDSRSGVTKSTLHDYAAYLRRDIGPALGTIPIDLLTPADIAAWVEGMAEDGAAGKTIANKHGFLSAALNTAVTARPPLIPHNPALGTRIPPHRTQRDVLPHPRRVQPAARLHG